MEKDAELYVDVNIFKPEHADILQRLKALPTSCHKSAEYLKEEAGFYSREDIFPSGTIDNFVRKLKAYDDKDLSERLYHKTQETRELVNKYLHCM
ncbi:MAG: hypothetical protein WDZ47_11330 [Bacteroidales bacterium]